MIKRLYYTSVSGKKVYCKKTGKKESIMDMIEIINQNGYKLFIFKNELKEEA